MEISGMNESELPILELSRVGTQRKNISTAQKQHFHPILVKYENIKKSKATIYDVYIFCLNFIRQVRKGY